MLYAFNALFLSVPPAIAGLKAAPAPRSGLASEMPSCAGVQQKMLSSFGPSDFRHQAVICAGVDGLVNIKKLYKNQDKNANNPLSAQVFGICTLV
ncbi:hypothetical protein M2375_003247 [Comamonas sp. BIGb0152]|uniref:hypothetical protein n=1 Tax=Comamonas sp. BIGb0152 TaxID=2940601 RepID=UPI0021691758|nr:hypothetical protein [Comamonas sp. BIGb0152]MCS4295014.1 hypothetical protein [Comamonas sp. BIGb0152]